MSYKIEEKKLDKMQKLLSAAKKCGATDAEVIIIEGSSVSVGRRMGEIESLIRSESQDIGLRVFVDKKSSIVSSSDTSAEALQKMAERAIAMAKSVPEDKFCGIANESEVAKTFPDLDIYDPTEVSVEDMLKYADEVEQAALDYKGITNSDGADFSSSKGEFCYIASNGFMGGYKSSDFSASVSVVAGSKADMQTDYDFDSTAYFSDLKDFSLIGRNAAMRAVKALNPKKIKTGKMPIVFDNRVSKTIVSSLASAISGSAVARGTSLLKDKMGEQIFSGNINIIDDPFMLRGNRSYPFDAEGIAPQKRAIIENGILQGWFLDLSCARQLGLKSTGNATRGVSSPPSPKPANLYMQAGDISFDELIADIKEGLFVTEMMGKGMSIVTGDYSRGARGFMIENGKITYPVAEVTIAGNLIDMWKNCTPADDLEFKNGIDAPSIRVEEMTVAGSNS